MKFTIGILLILIVSCGSDQKQTESEITIKSVKTDSVITETVESLAIEPERKSNVFWDSTSIGKSQLFKVRIEDYTIGENEHFINLQLFKKNLGTWELTQELEIEALNLMDMSPEFSDFNNDKFNDLTVISGTANRGSNEIRTLFLFDPKNEKFVHVKNSSDYPNLEYNSETKSITGWRFYAGCATDFLELHGDSLIHIATVEDEDGTWTSTLFNQDGTYKRIEVLTGQTVGFTRFSNFDPIKG
jgi:hypothetical protein